MQPAFYPAAPATFVAAKLSSAQRGFRQMFIQVHLFSFFPCADLYMPGYSPDFRSGLAAMLRWLLPEHVCFTASFFHFSSKPLEECL
jgi:hypothetical protein